MKKIMMAIAAILIACAGPLGFIPSFGEIVYREK